MAGDERTKDSALRTLMALQREEVEHLDEHTGSILTESLVTEVFEIAWRYQFEEDRRQPRRDVRDIVQDAAQESVLEEEA